MSDDHQRSLNHFAGFAFTAEFWELEQDGRQRVITDIQDELTQGLPHMRAYQIYPSVAELDLILWTATELVDDESTSGFMRSYVETTGPSRRYLAPQMTLWGYTAPSTYSRAKSEQEIDPFVEDRATYLAIYPFVKTEDWYLLSRDARQGMMNEHIRLGKQYKQIKQLLLYSFGIQDQEFVVVYETEDLPLFSKLVHELRATDARVYTQRDSPLYTGVLQPQDDPFGLWARS